MSYPNVLEEIEIIKSTYLPLSGGNLEGSITTTGIFVKGFDSKSQVVIRAGSEFSNGAGLHIYGNETSENTGKAVIWSCDTSNNRKYFVFNPDGSAIFNGNDVLTSAGGRLNGTLYTNYNYPFTMYDNTVSISDTTRQSSTYSMLCLGLDKNGKRGGGLEVEYHKDGSRSVHLIQRNRADSGYNFLRLQELQSGDVVGKINGYLIESIHSSSSNYIRYTNGIAICWGTLSGTASTAYITFPITFANGNYRAFAIDTGGAKCATAIGSRTTSNCILYCYNSGNTWGVDWIAIGRWK